MSKTLTYMKKYLFAISAVILSLAASCDPAQDTGTPEIVISEFLNIPSDSGTATIKYELVNAVENGYISANATETWITGFDYSTPGEIGFRHLSNDDTVSRNSVVRVTYTYGDKSVYKEINVIQEGGVHYDYEYLSLDNFYGIYNENYGIGGEYNYNTTISDMPMVGNGDYIQEGGTYYMLDFYAPAPTDPDKVLPPAGRYTLSLTGQTEEMTFSSDLSKATSTTENGDYIFDTVFIEGTADISYNGEYMILEAFLTDADNMTHHIRYSGPADYSTNDTPSTPVIENDISFTASGASAFFVSKTDDVMEVNILLSDSGTTLTLDAFMPFNENGGITADTYSISDKVFEPSSLYPGEAAEFMGYIMYMGTYAEHFDKNYQSSIGLINKGDAVITSVEGGYSIKCSLITKEGHTIACTYEGPLTVEGIPEPVSTLTEDYTLDIANATAAAEFMGDFYGTGGGNWRLNISSTTSKDSFLADFVCNSNNYSDGIIPGTYTAIVDFPAPGQYLMGYAMGSYFGGTLYVGELDSEGVPVQIAPATAGDLAISKNEDGTYTVSFRFQDDAGYFWDGSWTGVIELSDSSTAL